RGLADLDLAEGQRGRADIQRALETGTAQGDAGGIRRGIGLERQGRVRLAGSSWLERNRDRAALTHAERRAAVRGERERRVAARKVGQQVRRSTAVVQRDRQRTRGLPDLDL